jgi:hypothetical protein
MLWKCLGEKHVLPHLTDLDELKMTKVNFDLIVNEYFPIFTLDQRICRKGDFIECTW